MKKRLISTMLIVMLILALSSCTKKQVTKIEENNSQSSQTQLSDNTKDSKESTNKDKDNNKNLSKYSLSDFMPKKLNLKISYSGGFENGGEESYVEYVEGNRTQIRTVSTGTTVVKVLEEKNNAISIVYAQEEFYEKKNMLSKNSDKSQILLKAPLKVGTSWTDMDGVKESITAIDMNFKTPAGEFKVIEVTKETKDSVSKNYFAPGLGLIKSIFITNGIEFITEIKDIS